MSIRDLNEWELTATEKHLLGVLDWEHIDEAAAWTAGQLREAGVASITLTPNDATAYPFFIAARKLPHWGQGRGMREPYMVMLASTFGGGYPWVGIELSHDYCASKWGREHEWTGWVVSEFLTALSRSIRALEEA